MQCQASRAKCQVKIVTLENLTLLVAWDATPALSGEPIVEISSTVGAEWTALKQSSWVVARELVPSLVGRDLILSISGEIAARTMKNIALRSQRRAKP